MLRLDTLSVYFFTCLSIVPKKSIDRVVMPISHGHGVCSNGVFLLIVIVHVIVSYLDVDPLPCYWILLFEHIKVTSITYCSVQQGSTIQAIMILTPSN